MSHHDRDVPHQRNGVIRYRVGVGENYGNLPTADLARKFEETNMGPDEDLYDNFARGTLTDRTADTAKFEHEQARGGVNRTAGVIEHHYYGHRGCADYERPEMFLGFAGPEERDPRGSNVDPDMRKMKEQAAARQRFVRFTPDHSDFTTSGGRSEGQLMQDQQSLFRITRDRLKVFSRQYDGRREGQRRDTYRSVSNVKKQIHVQSYGDLIRDYALNPQRRANILCKAMIRDSKAWREGTSDQDYHVAKYTQLCRRAQRKDTFNRVLGAQNADDTVWSDADTNVPMKSMGLLMASIINAKKTAHSNMTGSDRDYAEAKRTQDRKTAPLKKDLEMIMYMVSGDGDLSQHDSGIAYTAKAPETQEHLARLVMMNHLTPAHQYLNAELIYKSLKESRDFREIRSKVIVDPAQSEVHDKLSLVNKSKARKQIAGALLKTAEEADRGESRNTYSYRAAVKKRTGNVVRDTSHHPFGAESDNSAARKTSQTQYRVSSTKDVAQNTEFNDNASRDRRTGSMGTKYTMRQVDRDGAKTLSDLS